VFIIIIIIVVVVIIIIIIAMIDQLRENELGDVRGHAPQRQVHVARAVYLIPTRLYWCELQR